MTKNITVIIFAIAVVVALGLSVFNFLRPATVLVQTPEGKIVEVGAMPGSELPGPEFIVGGVKSHYVKETMRTATSTTCAIQSPTTASSTLVFGSANFVYASSTGAVWVHLAKASTKYATTTSLGMARLASGVKATVVASSTSQTTVTVDSELVFAPGNWFVVGIMGTAIDTHNAPKGTCIAEFKLIN